MKNMKWNCWNEPSSLGHTLPASGRKPQPTGPFGLRPKQGSSTAIDGGADSGERQCSEVGPWVGEMAGEVGVLIWSPAKKEAHQRAVSTGAWLDQWGTTVMDSVRCWRLAARGSGRWSGHGRSLGWRVGGRRRLGDGRRLEQRRTMRGRVERTRRERWSREVKKSGFASGPIRAGDKDARGGAHGRPRWSSDHHCVAKQLAHMNEASDRVPFKRRLRLTSGPRYFFIYQDFQTPTLSVFHTK
jgi:hypothetical protein